MGRGGSGVGGGEESRWRGWFVRGWGVAGLALTLCGAGLLGLGWGVCFRTGQAEEEGPLGLGPALVCQPHSRLSVPGRLEWAGRTVEEHGTHYAVAAALGMAGLAGLAGLVSLGAGLCGARRPGLLRLCLALRAGLLGGAAFLAAYKSWLGGRAVLPEQLQRLARDRGMEAGSESEFLVGGWVLASVLLYLALVATLVEAFAFCRAPDPHPEPHRNHHSSHSARRHRTGTSDKHQRQSSRRRKSSRAHSRHHRHSRSNRHHRKSSRHDSRSSRSSGHHRYNPPGLAYPSPQSPSPPLSLPPVSVFSRPGPPPPSRQVSFHRDVTWRNPYPEPSHAAQEPSFGWQTRPLGRSLASEDLSQLGRSPLPPKPRFGQPLCGIAVPRTNHAPNAQTLLGVAVPRTDPAPHAQASDAGKPQSNLSFASLTSLPPHPPTGFLRRFSDNIH